MSFHRSVVCALALFVGLPVLGGGMADAAFIRRGKIKEIINSGAPTYRVIVVVGDDNVTNAVDTVEVSVESDAGDEEIPLIESDAWLHGAASLSALPKTDATLTLTLYDNASASLMSFSGTLGTDGSVSLLADAVKETGGCTSKSECTDTTVDAVDIEVLAGEVFAASGGYELTVDLAGADTYDVAYATFIVTESTEVTTCNAEKVCTTTGSSTSTKAEVGWDAIGAVWEGDLAVQPEGLLEVKAKAYDVSGEKLESAKMKLGVPWVDGGDGVNALATDEDPLTTVAFFRKLEYSEEGIYVEGLENVKLAVNSSGWTPAEVPVAAQVELTGGDTITIPVNSYHRVRRNDGPYEIETISFSYNKTAPTVTITGGGVVFADDTLTSFLDSPICASGGCFLLTDNGDDTYDLSISVYGTDAATLPDDLELTVTVTDASGEELYAATDTVEFDEEITAVFANEVDFSADPIGLDLSGKVSLLGAANKKGKQETLAKGKFYGSFSRDGDGDLTLAGADKDVVQAKGDILIGGEPIDVEMTTDTNKDGVLNGPALATYTTGNRSGAVFGVSTLQVYTRSSSR